MQRGGRQLHLSRSFKAGSLAFFVGSPDRELIDLAEELFADLPTSDPMDDDVPCFVLSRSATSPDDEGTYDLAGPIIGSMTGLPLAGALTWLVSGLSRASLDVESGRLHLHAAGAVRGGRAAVLVGRRETGKTTTLAHLALNGWGFISDETISIGPRDDEVRGFAKPLSIKPGGEVFIPELTEHLLPVGGPTDGAVHHVALGAVGATTCEAAEPKLVAVLRRVGGPSGPAEASSTRLHPVDAVVALMGETMDAGRFGSGAAFELARLAARCHCHEIVLGSPTATVTEVERLFDEPLPAPLPVEQLPQGGAIRPDVTTVLVGDRAVVHEHPEGRIFAFDTAATEIWLTLGEWEVAAAVDLEGPVVREFVDQLATLGLVSREA